MELDETLITLPAQPCGALQLQLQLGSAEFE